MTTKTDPLAEFRKPDRTRTAQPYSAYELSNELQRHLEIRVKWPDPAEAPSYAFLRDIRGEWREGLQVTLFYTHPMQVIITGRNLTDLYRALQKGIVPWVQEFDPDEGHIEPDDFGAAFIKSIEIKTAYQEELPPIHKRH